MGKDAQPSIFYGCTELFYNRKYDEDSDPNTPAWESKDGNYSADRAFLQITLSQKNDGVRENITGLPENISKYSAVYIDPSDPKNVHLFKNGVEMGKKGMTIGMYLASCLQPVATVAHGVQNNNVNDGLLTTGYNSESGFYIMADEQAALFDKEGYYLGINATLFFSYGDSEGKELTYFELNPINAFLFFPFKGEANLERHGIILKGGYINAIDQQFGMELPYLGGGVGVYLADLEAKEYPLISGSAVLGFGAAGGIDTGSEEMNSFEPVNSDEKIVTGNLKLRLKTSREVTISTEGIYANLMDQPSFYEYALGIGGSLRMTFYPTKLFLGYYLLDRTGVDGSSWLSHRISGRFDVVAFEAKPVALKMGLAGNLFTTGIDKTEEFNPQLGFTGADSGEPPTIVQTNRWDRNRSYAKIILGIDIGETAGFEAGFGIMKNSSDYEQDYNYDDFEEEPSYSQDEWAKFFDVTANLYW